MVNIIRALSVSKAHGCDNIYQNVKGMWLCYSWTTFNHIQQLYKSKYVS